MEATLLPWVSSKLRSAVIKDVSKDFCDGTALMELIVLLLEDEGAVSKALNNFTQSPSTMSHSLENIKSVLTCLAADGCHLHANPLDIFRGKREVILSVLETLRERYDMTNESRSPSLTQKHDIITGSSLTQKHDIITGSSTLSKEDIITDWARTVVEHTDSLLREKSPSSNDSGHSDHDTGFIEPSSLGSGGEEDNGKTGSILPDPRPQDESYETIDFIEVDEKLVRADSKIVLSHDSQRRACVFVSISMKYEVTDLAARDSFLKQATKNYVLSGCEVPHKDLHSLGLGYLKLLVTCSYTRSLRTKSVGIYSPFLLGLQTINIAENRQLFAHVLRGRVKLTANQRPEHVKITMKNISKVRIHVVIPEGCVWQQIELNGDSNVVSKEGVVRSLYPEETEVVSIPSFCLNKQGGKSRGLSLQLTPFIFRGPLTDQEKLFSYSDPEEDGFFRFCNDCNGLIYRDMYGISYFNNRPYHLECGPSCTKCGLACLTPIIKDGVPFCSLDCYYLSLPAVQYCTKCGYVLTPDDNMMVHKRCPKICRICDMLCLDTDNFPGPVCTKLCQDWDTSKNQICQGCALPITHKSTAMEIDKMFFHSVHCFKIRTTSPPIIIQRAMVRGKQYEAQELRRLTKLEFEKRSERRRESLRLRKEERERKHNLQNVMDCITKIEGNNITEPENKKFGTLQPPKRKKSGETRTRSLSSAGEQSSTSRKRTDTRPLDSRMSTCSDTGSFLDLLFSSDDEDIVRPCSQFSRSLSDQQQNRKRPSVVDFEKRKLNRGFPSGERQGGGRPPRARSRQRSCDSDSSDVVQVISAPARPSKRFMSLKRSASKGSTGSNSSSSTNPSPVPKIEFERPNLFDQLRCEVNQESASGVRQPRQSSSSSNCSNDRLQGRNTVPKARSPSNFKDNEVSNNQNIRENGTRNTIARTTDRRESLEHRIQVYRQNGRKKSGERYTSNSSKEVSPSDAFLSVDRRMSSSSGRSRSSDNKKISPAFTCLLTEDSPSSSSSKPLQGRRTNYISPRKYNGEDPLAFHTRNINTEKRSCPVEAPPRTVSAAKVSTTLDAVSPTKLVPSRAHSSTIPEDTPRVIIPMTEAQKRYERRFSRSRSIDKSGEAAASNDEILLTPSYPPELLSGMGCYSLDMIKPTEEEVATSATNLSSLELPAPLEGTVRPVLEDALSEPHFGKENSHIETKLDDVVDNTGDSVSLDEELHLQDLTLGAVLDAEIRAGEEDVTLGTVGIDAELDMDIENSLLELDEDEDECPETMHNFSENHFSGNHGTSPYFSGNHGTTHHFSGNHGTSHHFSGDHGTTHHFSGDHGTTPHFSGNHGTTHHYSGNHDISSDFIGNHETLAELNVGGCSVRRNSDV